MTTTEGDKTSQVITLQNGVTIELLLDDSRLRGLGEIRIEGVPVRAGTIPLTPVVETAEGVDYREYLLKEVREEGDAVVLVTAAVGTQELFGEWRDEYDFQMAWPKIQPERCEDRLEWILRPESLQLDGVAYNGFSYALRYFSEERQVHLITMQATWELGGSAPGNTLLYQGQVNPPVHECTPGSRFSTECLRQLSMAGDPFGYSFQFSSRYSPVQCFDFQYGEEGCLLGYWPEFVSVHSLIQKNPDEEIVFVLDKYWFPQAKETTLPRKCILRTLPPPERVQKHWAHDCWQRALDHAQGIARAAYSIPKTYVVPEVGTPYEPSLDAAGKLLMHINGQDYPPDRVLYVWGDMLKDLAAQGVRRIFPEVMAESDITEAGYRYKLQSGIHGDMKVSSTCQVWRYRCAEFWGGWDAWEYFYEKGKEAGLEIGHWCGLHLSCNAPIFEEHPEFICRHVNTRPHAGGYAFNLCFGLNWNQAGEWMLEQWAEWKEHGLDYIFFDSMGNIGLLGTDFSHDMEPNAPGIAQFIGELAKLGVKAFTVEGIGPFGAGRFGLSDNKAEDKPASEAVAGQNDWSWWIGNEDMLVDCLPMLHAHPERTDEELQQQFFRVIANRGLASVYPIADWVRSLWHTYNALSPLMVRRSLLPQGRGVHWTGGEAEVLFAYQAFDHPLPAGARVEKIVGGQAQPVSAGAMLCTEPYTVYRLCAQ